MRVVQLAIVILGIIFSTPSGSCPIINFSDYLTSISDGVMVSYDNTNIVFDDSGNFVREFPMEPSRIIGMSDDGRLWAFRTEDHQTIISSYTNSGSLIREYEFKGSWKTDIHGDLLLVGRDENSGKFQIHTFNPQLETLEHYVSIVASSRVDRFAVGRGLICTVSMSDPNAISVVMCFNEDGTQQWQHEYYGEMQMFAYVEIDSQNNVYVIGSTIENRRPAILQFDRNGNLGKEIPGMNGIFGFAVSDRGSLFVADQDVVVYHYDSHGKLVESWDASTLVANETWPDRRNKERTAESINEFSTTDDLIVAALNGRAAQRAKATKWLFARGPQIIPQLMEQCFSGSGFTLALLDRAMLEMPEESILEMARRFPKAGDAEKEEVAPKLIDAGRIDVPGLQEFLENKIQNTHDYERFDFETLLVQMGKGRNVLEEYWRRFQMDEVEIEDLTVLLSYNLSESSEMLEPSLLNSFDPWNPIAEKLIIDALTWSLDLDNRGSFKTSDMEKFEKWMGTANQDLIRIATVCSVKAGNLKQLGNAIRSANEDLRLAPAVLKIATDEMIDHPELRSEFRLEIYELAKKVIFSKSNDTEQYFEQDFLKRFMQFAEFRDLAVLDALQSFESSTKNQEFIISNYLGPELVSREVVSGFLATPISSNEKYWKYVDLIATRYTSDPFVKQQIRRLMLSQISSDSPYASEALKILAKVGDLSDSGVISNLVRHGSKECEACTFHEGLKTLGHIGVSEQYASNIFPYLEIEPVIAAAALSRAAFPNALQILLDEAGKTSGYHPIELTGSMFAPYGKEAEDGLLSKLENVNDPGREKILVLLAEMGSKAGYNMVRKQFDDALKEEQFPSYGSIAALMMYGQDPWSELLEHLAEAGDECDGYLMDSFPSRLRIQAATRIAQLMLNENDTARFKILRCWLYEMDHDEETEYLIQWVHLNHSNAKMRKLMVSY